MAGKFCPPKELDFSGNLSQNWKKWKREFNLYLTATEAHDKSDAVKTSRLLTAIGSKARDVYYTFAFEEEGDDMKLDRVLRKFDEYMSPKKNITYMRYKFFSYNQVEGQSIDDYITELKSRSEQCEFGELKSSLIRDKVVIGVNSKKIQERLLRETELSLDKAIQICRAAENVKMQSKEMKGTLRSDNEIDLVRKDTTAEDGPPLRPVGRKRVKKCKYCGGEHEYGKCPAFKRQCNKCGKLNHFAVVCQSKSVRHVKQSQHRKSNCSSSDESDGEFTLSGVDASTQCKEVNEDNISDHISPGSSDTNDGSNSNGIDSEEFFINTLQPNECSDQNRWLASLDTSGTLVSYMLDTGAQVNVLPESIYNSLRKKPKLHRTKIKLTAYDGGNIPVLGKCIAFISKESRKSFPVQFVVVPTNSTAIIGLETCEKLNLIKRISIVNDKYSYLLDGYEEVFGDIGCLPGEYHINVDPTVTPVVHPARRVPFALKDKLKRELERMQSLEVIEKVDKPTDWVNSIVLVEKSNGDIRVCLDPKDLNRAVKREFSQMPTAEEIMSQMAGAKFFSKLDASAGYWQIKLDEASSDLLAFNTPFGRYKFKRLPFGVHCASEVFSKRVSELIDGLEGVAHIQDDIIVWGSDKDEHDNNLKAVLSRIKDSGLKLNKKKCEFGVQEIKYVGHIFSDKGLCADPSKVDAIARMPVPETATELHRFLGMVAYLRKFIPDLSTNTSELRKLLETNTEWNWSDKHTEQFTLLQQLVTSSPVLKYFDPKLPIKVSVDASKSGLGAVLLQLHDRIWCPVAYANRALTKSEQNYSQIEKETLAVVFGTEHFNQYVYAQKFLVESDHKPLQAIFKRNVNKAPPRIQRMLLRLQKYDLELYFSPGSTTPVADTLSRAPILASTHTAESVFDYQVHLLLTHLPISDAKLKEIQSATVSDGTLQEVKKLILNGWPDNTRTLQKEVIPYFQFRSELSVAHGLLFKQDRVIIPSVMRREIKEKIHQGHLGIEKCKARAREVVFWPGINAELTEMVKQCSACIENQQYQQKEPLIPHEVPAEPWCKVGMDLFSYQNQDYLVVVDYYSNYPEVCSLKNSHSSTIISHVKSIFARHGIPNIVVSDNGPQFSSFEFKQFAASWEFKHITSSPSHPKSNGMAESAVKTIKKLFKKAFKLGEDPYLALLAHRSTPSSNDTKSPAKKLMGRHLRTSLPDLRRLIAKPKRSDELPAKCRTSYRQKIQQYHNRATKQLPDISVGSTVRIHEKGQWPLKAKVLKKASTPRSFVVETEKGTIRRRNRQDLMTTGEHFSNSPADCDIPLAETTSSSALAKDTINVTPPPENQPRCSEGIYQDRLRVSVRPPKRFGFEE